MIYFLKKLESPEVQDFVSNYLWPQIADSVEDSFRPPGLVQICGKPLWGLNICPKDNQLAVLGVRGTASAGGFMGNVLGKAIQDELDKESSKELHMWEVIANVRRSAQKMLDSMQ